MEKQGVKMNVSEILKAYTGVATVIGEKKLFSGEVNLAIAKNYKILEGETKTYNENVDALVEKFVHKDREGKPETKEVKKGEYVYVFETDENEKLYKKAIDELRNAEMEVEVNMITTDAFGTENEQPTAFDLVSLEFMIKE